ncbi:MAG: zinc ribbon domain-containing protein [Deltaproteobacteria bacterium]|nr:zinc ribbon domain-containing protein [Smithella sp.]NMC95927.1 zinc ribbon domain-containing protein [Deltaproteobacteria bacterium]
MPIYEFRCKKCKHIFESLIFSPKEEKGMICPKCKAKNAEKIMSVFAGGKSGCSSCTSTSCSGCSSCGGH